MSGIAGILQRDGRSADPGHLRLMADTLAHRGDPPCRTWIEGSAGLAEWSYADSAPALDFTALFQDPAGRRYLLDGRLDDLDGRTLTDLYNAHGPDLPDHLEGDFALAVWDPRGGRLLLARDAIGVRPLYYTEASGALLFASEIKALLAHPSVRAEPDADQLARHLVGKSREATDHSTFFAGIRRLGPAGRLIASASGIRVDTWWDFDRVSPIRYSDESEYVVDFREHFERAVERRLRSAAPVAVSMSGGLDSSSVFAQALELERAGRAAAPGVFAVTYTSGAGTPSDESAFVEALERFHDTRVHRVPAVSRGILQSAAEAVRQVESPFLDDLWDTLQASFVAIRERGARVVLTGHWADQLLFDQAYLVDLVRRGGFGTLRSHLREYRRWWSEDSLKLFRRRMLTDLLKYSMPPRPFSRLRNMRARRGRDWFSRSFRARLRNTADHPTPLSVRLPSAHARSLHEQIRSGHHLLSLEWDSKAAAYRGLDMAFPFLDRGLLSFLIAIPGEHSMLGGVPKGILREAMHGRLPEELRGRDKKADFTHFINENAARDLAEIGDWLGPEPRVVEAGWVDPEALRSALRRLRRDLAGEEASAAWSLSGLIGLELWLRVFIP